MKFEGVYAGTILVMAGVLINLADTVLQASVAQIIGGVVLVILGIRHDVILGKKAR